MGCCCGGGDGLEARCPSCDQLGEVIAPITPRHTLKAEYRGEVEGEYRFCPSADCPVVYFRIDGGQTFTTGQLIHRVTCKDESPETPLCYCFKIHKADATADTVKTIEEKMKKGCFCDRANPRGRCCLEEVRAWLAAQR